MGQALSECENNDALVDYLLERDYIRSPKLEQVLRAVDRAEHISVDEREFAYRDAAWKQDKLHLSAPCIYCETLNSLDLKPGLSFLNVGSGTGYLNTLVSLILGGHGVNHGIEIHETAVKWSQECWQSFVKNNPHFDKFEVCPPYYFVGDVFSIDVIPSFKIEEKYCDGFYDRVYVGAGCTNSQYIRLRHLLKVGGVMVIPIDVILMKIHRMSLTEWESAELLPVTFAPLLQLEKPAHAIVLPQIGGHVETLEHLCRLKIRRIIRDIVFPDVDEQGNKNLILPRVTKKKKKRRKRNRSHLTEDDPTSASCSHSNDLTSSLRVVTTPEPLPTSSAARGHCSFLESTNRNMDSSLVEDSALTSLSDESVFSQGHFDQDLSNSSESRNVDHSSHTSPIPNNAQVDDSALYHDSNSNADKSKTNKSPTSVLSSADSNSIDEKCSHTLNNEEKCISGSNTEISNQIQVNDVGKTMETENNTAESTNFDVASTSVNAEYRSNVGVPMDPILNNDLSNSTDDSSSAFSPSSGDHQSDQDSDNHIIPRISYSGVPIEFIFRSDYSMTNLSRFIKSNTVVDEESSSDSTEDQESPPAAPPPPEPNLVRQKILELELPPAILKYLLFYREC